MIFSPRNDEGDGHAQVVWANTAERTHYYLKEISAPAGYDKNPTVIPVVVGTYSIYADAGDEDDGVVVMAGVGKLTQTMRKFAFGISGPLASISRRKIRMSSLWIGRIWSCAPP